jgi:hypothetical protein
MPSGTELDAAELALVTNDKPMLIASHVIATAAPNTTNLRWLQGNALSGSDETAAGFPTKRIYDKHSHLITKPATPGAGSYDNWNLAMDLGAGHGHFDVVMISGHNFGTIGDVDTVVQVASSNAFSDAFSIAGTTPTTNKRMVFLVLESSGEAARWTDARYLRINMNSGVGANFIPEIGEVWVGRRRHLPYKFDNQLQDKRTQSEVTQFTSRSGITTSYSYSQGRAIREGTMRIDAAADISTVDSWWSESSYGADPFLWIEEPGTTPANCHVMTCNPELHFSLVGPTARALDLSMRENGPFLTGES